MFLHEVIHSMSNKNKYCFFPLHRPPQKSSKIIHQKHHIHPNNPNNDILDMVIDYSVYLLLIAFVKGTLFPTVHKYLILTYLWASLRNSQPVSSSSVALTARSRTFCWSTVFATALKTNLWVAFLFYFPPQLNLRLTWQPCTDRRFSRPPWRAPLRSWRPCWPPTPCGSGWEPGSDRFHHLFTIFVFFCYFAWQEL